MVKYDDDERVRKRRLRVTIKPGAEERSRFEYAVKDYMCDIYYTKTGKQRVREKPLPWLTCHKYTRKRNARRQEVPEGEYQLEVPELMGISKIELLQAEAAQVAVGFTLASTVREEEGNENERPKCLVFVVASERPLRLMCYVYNNNFADGTTDERFRTKRENSTELWADDAFERYGFGLDQFGNVEHNVWKEHILTGTTDRLEECGLPGPTNYVDDNPTFNAWLKKRSQDEDGETSATTAEHEKEFRMRLQHVASIKCRVEGLANTCLVKASEEGRLPEFEECKQIILQWPCVMSADEAYSKVSTRIFVSLRSEVQDRITLWYGDGSSTKPTGAVTGNQGIPLFCEVPGDLGPNLPV